MHIFFFFNDTATTEIYTLSLHDALPICRAGAGGAAGLGGARLRGSRPRAAADARSEEHTSELQSHSDLGCRLLLEKKKWSSDQDGGRGSRYPQRRQHPVRRSI